MLPCSFRTFNMLSEAFTVFSMRFLFLCIFSEHFMASIPVKICSCFPLVNNLSNSRMMDLNLFQKWPYNPFQTDGQEQVFL